MEIFKIKDWLKLFKNPGGAQFKIISRFEGDIEYVERIHDNTALKRFSKYDLGAAAGFSHRIMMFTKFHDDCIHVDYASFYYAEGKCVYKDNHSSIEINDITDDLHMATVINGYMDENVE